MQPYYAAEGITVYHGDCREVLPTLGMVDHVLTDPPYDPETHTGARTRAGRGRAKGSAPLAMGFDALPDVAFTAGLWRGARRWALIFCSLEMLGDYRRWAGGAWVRSGFWHRQNGTPQMSGDRPAQPGEGIAILHRPGEKRWYGGGHPAYYTHPVVRRGRVHPTQKPEGLFLELVTLYTDPGETICDPFMGSGTALVAAKRLGRQAIGIELNERDCEAACKRLAQSALPLYAPAEQQQGFPSVESV